MFGVNFKDLGALRRKGYHFIQNEEDDKMKILDSDRIIRFIELNEFGELEVINEEGTVIAVAKNIEISLNVVKGKIACTMKYERD